MFGIFARKIPVFEGVPAGVIPADVLNHPVKRIKEKELLPVPPPPRFNPPDAVAPWMSGDISGKGISGRDLGAMLVQLSVDGYMKIDKAPNWTEKKPKFQFVRTDKPADDLAEAPQYLLNVLFHRSDTITDDLVKQYLKGPNGRQLLEIAGINTGQVVGSMNNQPSPVRSALNAQTQCFAQYLKTAEVNSIKVDEAAGIFSRYLPWAIALGAAEHWAKVFQGVIASAQMNGIDDAIVALWMYDLAWYGAIAMSNVDFGAIDFGGLDFGGLDFIGDMIGGLGDLAGDLGDGLGDALGGIGEGLGDIVGDLFDF